MDNRTLNINDDERMATIPLIAHELDMAKLMKVIKCLVAIIIGLLLIIGIGVYEFMSCDFTDVVVDSDDGGIANYLKAGSDGAITNVEGNSTGTDTQD